MNPAAGNGFYRRDWGQTPTTPVKLARYIDGSFAAKGVSNARTAVKFLARGAASPAEAKTYLFLCLPFRYGGYGIERPLLNPKLHVFGKSYEVVSESDHVPRWEERRPDFLWQKSKLGLEYDSLEHHSGTIEMKRDAHRRGDLEFADIHVMTLTGSQLYSQQRFDKIARAIAKKTGKRLSHAPLDWRDRQDALRKIVLPL